MSYRTREPRRTSVGIGDSLGNNVFPAVPAFCSRTVYFFYFDESGSRDPSTGTPDQPKDHLYVLLAVGMFERQWRPFDLEISRVKLELADFLKRGGKGTYDLADCEIKSNWIRHRGARAKHSSFLDSLDPDDLNKLVATYYRQISARKTVLLAAVIDKRELYPNTTHDALHKKAYEFMLERIEHYMRTYHPRHQALIVMDDTSKQLNRAITLQHAQFQRSGNPNMHFPRIVEYPFFTRSELSNGVQLADLMAYNVYRAFKDEDFDYRYFQLMLPNFYRRPRSNALDGLKVWPDASPLVALASEAWSRFGARAASDVGLG